MALLYWLESIRTPFLDTLMQIFTYLGDEILFIVIALAVFWCVDKREGYYLLFVGFFGTILNQFLKLLCRIPRPWVRDPEFTAVEAAKAKGIQMKVGNILSSDNFYGDCDPSDLWAKMGVMAVEMEAAGLYMNAARAGKRALCICTISDHIMLPEEILTSDQRQTAMTQMIEIALDTAAAMNEA